MTIRKPIFWDYATFDDEEGFLNGIQESAPDWAKEAYAKYLQEQEARERLGAKV